MSKRAKFNPDAFDYYQTSRRHRMVAGLPKGMPAIEAIFRDSINGTVKRHMLKLEDVERSMGESYLRCGAQHLTLDDPQFEPYKGKCYLYERDHERIQRLAEIFQLGIEAYDKKHGSTPDES